MAQRKPRHTIGLILSNVTNDFSGYLIEQMEELFTENGYKLIVTTTNHSIDSEREMLQMFGKITDGILIISDAICYSELADVIPRRIPVIFLNRKPSGCPHTCIIENNYSAVYQAVLSNSANGNDKIALVCANHGYPYFERKSPDPARGHHRKRLQHRISRYSDFDPEIPGPYAYL